MTGEMIADTDDRQRFPPHRLIFKDHDTRVAKRRTNGSGGGPMIVIAENREHPRAAPADAKAAR